ncbi:hypothetical protein FA95DRAFT_1372663 [Auriscalpium vulgare]|uniref:Uncharacterized protein n=1 Tax=Auriscalpium vulgare TaxID=40419 RepID=A0ACB8RQU9_9AGAM|nr:hypothetical protein FA95DRAFT_1372663 [Auriscalpium vulgare]
MMSSKSKPNPLPLEDTLRDLAFIRAAEVDFGAVLPTVVGTTQTSDVDRLVDRSLEFVREAREAIKVHNKEDVGRQGDRVDQVRERLEEVVEGLESEA